ncbi:hypothetical protein [Actinokineospora globicatena]|uniref:hypothetical protein n=1 Tax=Actinokineospora globicatena TaxID=103729 RepID=UPI0020A45A4E|nr:hypothetical protein [Actinokineospora globicatena]MCP2303265.1 hypothetical protein [Actinokineospora globicatena]GLW79606.1 hypothetical protein Aglo01_40870 [Actinokineospora globicatena]GLW85984.1 hypothetical protein Aglo02_36240 [Actinokineospora globicatena]
MGLLTDYFRAPSAAVVVAAVQRSGGHSPVGEFDGVSAKWLEVLVVLGRLVVAATGESYRVGEHEAVWPTTPEPTGVPEDGDPWAEGPWVYEVGVEAHDALASITDPGVVAARLVATAEELDGASAGEWEPVVAELAALARRARAAGERLYCWMCL